MLFPLVTPEIVMGVSLLLVFTHVFTFIHTGTLAQILGHVTFSISFVVVIVRGRLFSIGRQYEEAAADLGASPVRRADACPAAAPDPGDRRVGGRRLRHLRGRLRHQPVALERRRHGHRADPDLQRDARAAPLPSMNAIATIMMVIHAPHRHRGYLAWRFFTRGERRSGRRRRTSAARSTPSLRPWHAARSTERLTKGFAEVTAVDAIDLQVPGGEFFSLLGPSGCGKTTTLRMIAGFERPTSGQILLDGTDVAYTPPHQRNVNTVFQNYALFPHLNVFDNIAFGLRRAKRPKAEIRERVGQALELVQLTGYERRKSSQLSGGQQQRVALARALVLNPAVLLLDEPLGALDAKLRKALQIELKALQQEVGITFLYVTHDQEEALTMSDRLAVMNGGHIEQVGAPQDVYEDPRDALRRRLPRRLQSDGRHRQRARTARLPGRGRRLRASRRAEPTGDVGERRSSSAPSASSSSRTGRPSGPNRIPGMVERVVYVGSAIQVIVRAATGETLQALVQNTGAGASLRAGDARAAPSPGRRAAGPALRNRRRASLPKGEEPIRNRPPPAEP